MRSVGATYRFTVDEFHRMAAAGVFTEDDRVELLEGEVTVMTPIDHRHAAVGDHLNERLGEALRGRVLVRVQGPVRWVPAASHSRTSRCSGGRRTTTVAVTLSPAMCS